MKTINDVKDVVIYLRRSQGDDLDVLEKHEKVAVDLCNQKGWSYIIKAEIGSGDSIDDRPVMLEVLDIVESGVTDSVIVSYYDRLGRGSGTDQDRITESFLIGDTLIIELFPFNVYNVEDDASEEMLAFKQFMARRDYKTINKRLNMGRKVALDMGRWIFSHAPYGYMYDRKAKKLAVHEENSKVLKHIFNMYLTGDNSTIDIAWNLNQSKILSPNNTLWTAKTVNEILKNEVYLGCIVHNKSKLDIRAKKEKNKAKKRTYNPKEEWVYVYNTHPFLINREDFDKVQEIMKANKKFGGKGINYLSGVVKCYNCKSTLPIMKDSDGNDVLGKCYKCNKCKGGQTEIVMDSIYESLSIMKKEIVRSNESELMSKERQILLNDIEKMDKKLETNYNALGNIEKAMEDGLYSYEKAKEKIRERQEVVYELEALIRKKREQLESFSAMTNKDRLKRIDEFIGDIKTYEGDKERINKAIKSIISNVIWKRTERDEIEVTVNFL